MTIRVVPDYSDEREKAFCTFCGGIPNTRDHCPSKVLLDEPYPPDLPVVQACETCNASFSSDEEYLACVVDCVLAGSTDPERVGRPKIARILSQRPALRARIEAGRETTDGETIFQVEQERVRNAIFKLAAGHAAYELAIYRRDSDDDASVSYKPAPLMSEAEIDDFISVPGNHMWPEVGSRMMNKLLMGGAGWQVVQDGRYRYCAAVEDGIVVRIILSEYLACEVRWP